MLYILPMKFVFCVDDILCLNIQDVEPCVAKFYEF